MKNLATNLQALRKKKQMSQTELANRAGMSQSRISHYENGKALPDLRTVAALATVLGCSFDDLLGKPEDYIKDDNGTQRNADIEVLSEIEKSLDVPVNHEKIDV